MGKNNKARRAAKAKKRREHARRTRRQEHATDEGALPPSDVDLIVAAAHAADRRRTEAAVELLLERPRERVAAELADILGRQVARVWDIGWQPADLVRAMATNLDDHGVELVRCAIAENAKGYEKLGETVAPEWMAQLSEIEATREWDPSMPWPLQVGRWRGSLESGIRLVGYLWDLPEIPTLTPPPSQWSTLPAVEQARLAPGVLAKVRALLAKAESTTFDAEAEALTAKAQELMTRHRIDRATVSSDGSGEKVVGRRVGLDRPYVDAKSLLAGGIAHANGCRAVWSKEFGFITLFGYPDDLDGTETLFTSLLVQASSALQREGSKHYADGRSRTKSFRRSFLIAFAVRISQRLEEAADQTVEAVEVETGRSLLPALASRVQEVEEMVEENFPEMRQVRMSGSDYEGYVRGTEFGDAADLGTGPAPGDRVEALSGYRAGD